MYLITGFSESLKSPQDKAMYTGTDNLQWYKDLFVNTYPCCIQVLKMRKITSAGRRSRLFHNYISEGEQNTHYFVNARRERTAARKADENNACSV